MAGLLVVGASAGRFGYWAAVSFAGVAGAETSMPAMMASWSALS